MAKHDPYKFSRADGDRGRFESRQRSIQGRLTPKQDRFLDLIVEGNHINHAYMQSYGCSLKSAGSRAYTILKKGHMQRALDRKFKEAGKRSDVTIDEVISTIRRATKGAESEGRWNDTITGAKALGQYIGMWDTGPGEKRNPFQGGETEDQTYARLKKIANANQAAVATLGKKDLN